MSKVAELLAVLLLFWEHYYSVPCFSEFTRDDFPADFVFGAGTSAFQGESDEMVKFDVMLTISGSIPLVVGYSGSVPMLTNYEGAWVDDGKSPSIWDTFTHEGWAGVNTPDTASDGYHKYKVCGNVPWKALYCGQQICGAEGLQCYPADGRGPVNPKGIGYYNNVINELIKHGIQPHVTLHHLDVPQVLQDEYGGWLSPKIIDDFKELADVCFKEFGDRVSHWTTINQPNINSLASFDYGFFPPQRCSYPYGANFTGGSANCTGGNSTVEPYITVHNYILAHSAAVELYRRNYQLQKIIFRSHPWRPWLKKKLMVVKS
ncbi:hypothetical protein IEQ34_000625 [Dendrobium chrysotoxum]|uniref:Beta-glucosidase n=1 Tax=Dendrobium chrysotoxum TaxID=161865 RepID=A0AAV7HQZ5_DENCH|nr:hypothetical protein IEQ34_000625 [Dendrobium chrysotoxum]